MAETKESKKVKISIGAYGDAGKAKELVEALKGAGYKNALLMKKKAFSYVIVTEADEKNVENIIKELKEKKYNAYVLAE